MKDNRRFGEVVYIRYRGGVAGESPVDVRDEGEPLKLMLGAGHVIPGIEDALCDMHPGDEATLVIPPEEAYGRYQEDAVQVFPRSMFSFGAELEVGDVFQWTNPASGQPIPVRVIDAAKDVVTVDFNHPFAGKTLEYWVKMEQAPK